jgi:hypothetical protein
VTPPWEPLNEDGEEDSLDVVSVPWFVTAKRLTCGVCRPRQRMQTNFNPFMCPSQGCFVQEGIQSYIPVLPQPVQLALTKDMYLPRD